MKLPVNESSLSRIYAHVKGNVSPQFAILTSWRSSEIDNEETEEGKAMAKKKQLLLFKKFLDELRMAGYGYIKLQGKGEEFNPVLNRYFVSTEPSVFVPNMLLADAGKLAKRYKQTSYMYAGPETGGKLNAIYTETGEHTDLGVFTPRKLGMYWSTLRNGRAFTFGDGA